MSGMSGKMNSSFFAMKIHSLEIFKYLDEAFMLQAFSIEYTYFEFVANFQTLEIGSF